MVKDVWFYCVLFLLGGGVGFGCEMGLFRGRDDGGGGGGWFVYMAWEREYMVGGGGIWGDG